MMRASVLSALSLVLLFAVSSPGSNVAAQSDSDVEPLTPAPWHDFDNGGPRTVVIVENSHDGRFAGRGDADLDRIRGDSVTPQNIAEAHASCTDCQTIAVALQVALYQRGASNIAPVNRAVALNTECTSCMTIARAVQYVIPVDDLDYVPHELNQLVQRVDQETDYLHHIKELDTDNTQAVQAHLDQMEADFADLQQFLIDYTDAKQGTTSPMLAPQPGVSGAPAASPAQSPAADQATPAATDAPSATAVPSATVP